MYALGNGFYFLRSGNCHVCKTLGPCLGYSEPYDATGGDYCKRCSLGSEAQYPTNDVTELIDLWNRGERAARACAISDELRRNMVEAQEGVREEERFNQVLHGVYR